jgi:hypothetical protein
MVVKEHKVWASWVGVLYTIINLTSQLITSIILLINTQHRVQVVGQRKLKET